MGDKDKPVVSSNQVIRQGPGSKIDYINSPKDCNTLYVDGINGIAMSSQTTRINFIEQIPSSDGIQGRHVINMIIPNDEMIKIIKVLNASLEALEAAKNGADEER